MLAAALLVLWTVCCHAVHSNESTAHWKWSWAQRNSSHCADCHLSNLCSTDVGAFLKSEHIPSDLDDTNACIRFHSTQPILRSEDVVEVLGDNAVIAFVGDSNTRNLFLSALQFFGLTNWFADLDIAATNWTATAQRRHAIDHTYLCPKSFGPRNLTLAFLWMPFVHKPSFYTRRVWSRCGGRAGQCPSAIGIPYCDQSSTEGMHDRWQCGDWLDEVQYPNIEMRKFVVVSHGGIHDVLHTYHAQIFSEDKLNATKQAIHAFHKSLKTNGKEETLVNGTHETGFCWSTHGHHGAEIHINPLQLGRANCHHCVPQHRTTVNRVIKLVKDDFTALGLRRQFDGYVDAYTLTQEEHQAPFSSGDGIHYPPIVYRAMLELVLQEMLKAKFE